MLEDKTTENEHCCAPQRGKEKSSQVHQQQKTGTGHEDMVPLDGGEFLLGTNYRYGLPKDGEKPTVQARVSPFAIDRFVVTNGQYAAFVEEAGYRTEAEQIGWSFLTTLKTHEECKQHHGGAKCMEPAGNSPKGLNHLLRKEWIIPPFIFHGMMQLLMHTGLVDVFQQKLSGSMPRKAV